MADHAARALESLDEWYELSLDEGVRRIAEGRRRDRCLKPAPLGFEAQQHNKDDVMLISSIQIANEVKQRPLGLTDVIIKVSTSKTRRQALWQALQVPLLFASIFAIALVSSHAMYGDFLG